MDKDFILNKWVPALRSGKYKQGKLRLRNAYQHYCCLGVACDVSDPAGWSDHSNCWKRHKDYMSEELGRSIFGDVANPKDPLIMVNCRLARLSAHNDVFDATFDEIADGLEAWVREQEAAA